MLRPRSNPASAGASKGEIRSIEVAFATRLGLLLFYPARQFTRRDIAIPVVPFRQDFALTMPWLIVLARMRPAEASRYFVVTDKLSQGDCVTANSTASAIQVPIDPRDGAPNFLITPSSTPATLNSPHLISPVGRVDN